MSTFWMIRAATGISALLLSACVNIDKLEGRFIDLNKSFDAGRNEGILLNIARASTYQPLNFVGLGQVDGVSNSSLALGLPSFAVGRGAAEQTSFGSASANVNRGKNANFKVSTQETRDFYVGILSPIPLNTINFFLSQNHPRELLFWLFVESIRVTYPGEPTRMLRNDPQFESEMFCGDLTAGFEGECFESYVNLAISSGLTVETKPDTREVIKEGTQIKEQFTNSRLCYDPLLADEGRSGLTPICKISPWTPDNTPGNFLTSSSGGVKFEISSRSLYEVYQYLGSILAYDRLLPLVSDVQETGDEYLLYISRSWKGGCTVSVRYLSQSYCVPLVGARNTKRVLSILAQLQALQTSPGDLPATSTIFLSTQ